MRHILTIAILSCIPILATAQGIVQGEYFWNNDPGEGNGTLLVASDGDFGDAVEAVLLNTTALPSSGIHTFHVRIQDENDGWSPVFSTVIIVEDLLANARLISVTAGEYFWNEDPGEGNGTPMLAFDGNFNSAIETVMGESMNLQSEGTHVLNIRVRDAENQWSATFSTVMDILSDLTTVREIRISAAEYFWGSDPGQGNGTPMLAFDGNFDEAIETVVNENVNIPSAGTHVLSIRVRDAQNVWSEPFGVVINVEPAVSSVRDVEVTAGEYFFDADPGEGNGTPMLALDGNFNSAIEAIKGGDIPTPIVEGIHVLWMRARDAENNWGPAFGIVVNMDTTITGFEALINGPTEFCQGDNLLGAAYSAQAATGSTYTWSATNGVIINGQGSPNVTVNWNPSGERILELTQCLDGQCETASVSLVVYPTYSETASVTICEGESVFLGGAEQTQPGDYTDTYESVNGCDSVVVTTLFVGDEIVNNATASICEGESIMLGGAMQTEAGTYTDTYESSAGCDSLVVTELTVHPTWYNDEVVVSICDGDSALLSGDYQTVPGFYTDLYVSVHGCDSVVVSELVVENDPQPSISLVETELQTSEYIAYQWYFDGEPIDGATGMTYEPLENGTYTVEVTDENGCSGISEDFVMMSVGMQYLTGGVMEVFPNPTSGLINLQLPSAIHGIITIQVIDVSGQSVFFDTSFNENRTTLNLSGMARGTYLLQLRSDDQIFHARIVLM